MALNVKKAEYFSTIIVDDASKAHQLLAVFAKAGIGLLAFKAAPAGPGRTQFSVFPNDPEKMKNAAAAAGILLDGPHPALIVKSDSDEPGECAGVFEKLSRAGIHVYEACGIADIKDSYGIVLYMTQGDCEKALAVFRN
ncbi:MAG: hypothetical protein JXQ80_08435 [Bacteroidales bacterium]|nr:hypothetical protein [Bacteroidales bacterium]